MPLVVGLGEMGILRDTLSCTKTLVTWFGDHFIGYSSENIPAFDLCCTF